MPLGYVASKYKVVASLDQRTGGGSIWVAASSNSSPRNSSVIQLDPRSGRIIQTIPVGSPNHAITCGIAATHDAVWVTVGDANCDINGQ